MFTKKMSFKQIFAKITFAFAVSALTLSIGCNKDNAVVNPQEDNTQTSLVDSSANVLKTDGTQEVFTRGTCDNGTCTANAYATFNNVPAYINACNVREYNCVNGIMTGLKWQCVEYVNRYYLVIYGIKISSSSVYGDAKNYYLSNSHADIGLVKYANGTVAPQVGDIVVSTSGSTGHVAIIKNIVGNRIEYIDQNYNSNPSRTLTLNGNTIGSFDINLPVAGLVRKKTIITPPAQTPTLGSPAVNATNLTGSINFSWSSPNATEYRIQIIDAALFTGFNTTKGFVTSSGAESPNCAYNQNTGSQTAFTWTNAQPGKTYYWAVRANNSGGASSFSSYRSFTTAALPFCNLSASSYNITSVAVNNGLATSVSTNASSWTIASSASWISVTKLNNGFVISCQANTSISSRTGTITVNAGGLNRTVTITQAGAPITLSVSPTSRSITSAAVYNGLATTVSTNAPSWTVTSNASWISVTKLNNGFVISCQSNTLTYSRTGTITINANGVTQTVTITQAKK